MDDKATVPIYYESRLARIDLLEKFKRKFDDEIVNLTEDMSESEEVEHIQKVQSSRSCGWLERRISFVAADRVEYAESRFAALEQAATPGKRLSIIAGAIEWVLAFQRADAAREQGEEAGKRAHRCFADARSLPFPRLMR